MTDANSSREGFGSLYGASTDEGAQKEAFTSGKFPVAVYGLGKMGLPLAAVFAEICGNVIGVDIDPDVVSSLQNGDCHIKQEPGLGSLVADLVNNDSLQATTEPREAARDASIHVVIVPTPITEQKEPDLAILDTVIADIATGLTEGDIVLVECTVPPKTTETRVFERLLGESDLNRGEFGVAFCPERTSSGRALEDIRGAYPKVVGGIDDESTRAASVIYDTINSEGVLTVSDATTAEAVKLFEGLYRDVNIALANELGQFTDELGIDVREAIDIANTQPFCHIHNPGPGVGGHCIPYYPYFLIKPFETPAPLLSAAREVNDSMPSFTVAKVREGLESQGIAIEDAKIVILGLTYRPGVKEIRASPAISISQELSALDAEVFGIDPLLDSFEEFDIQPIEQDKLYELSVDGLILVTPHEEFEQIQWTELDDPAVIIDGRASLENLETDSWVYTIGRGKQIGKYS
ncbi:nucleotide sugar dehydrogenase [Haloplanus aerogenes]|uniref:UDP-N-acetyl-D-mannosamine dehydrogenase n=1 Tax=Haloplanus aerogenes TaxID=660522 RepID=A0A3M0E5P5_9EURY|nr:nucleotide sugar dehydrogenase [Haloplanus aerogenes]AZH24763.1 nucleotide sugar dehydrogenase [Haloplanus aerogenes]RMB23573.1 UDP-N-acetyl-D-mannosaminuronic acid dehydrogenase [Haloplanus aerogenes]